MPLKYQLLASALREQILRGDCPPGSMLPTEQQLCRSFDVSRQTVRAALHFVPVESVDQVFAAALVPSPAVSAVEHMTALPMEPAAPALRV